MPVADLEAHIGGDRCQNNESQWDRPGEADPPYRMQLGTFVKNGSSLDLKTYCVTGHFLSAIDQRDFARAEVEICDDRAGQSRPRGEPQPEKRD